MHSVRGRNAAFAALVFVGMFAGLIGAASAVHSGTPPARPVDRIWANDQLWDTTALGELHGATPAHTLDYLYVVPGQKPVSAAAPGDSDYNGGRWQPVVLAWTGAGAQPLFTDGEDVEAAIASGDFAIAGMGTPFLCPLTNPNDS